ncbi:hypothetical protein Tco_1485664 [Tanacetum coccineum]
MLKAGKLSHLIKELKQNSGKEQPKTVKKGETSGKDKALAILMIQPWERVARQKITQISELFTTLDCSEDGIVKNYCNSVKSGSYRVKSGRHMMMKHPTMKMHQKMKEGYDIWAMEMEHFLEYIDNDVWKVIQNGNSKKRISTGKDGVVRILPPVSAAEMHAVEKERKARTNSQVPQNHLQFLLQWNSVEFNGVTHFLFGDFKSSNLVLVFSQVKKNYVKDILYKFDLELILSMHLTPMKLIISLWEKIEEGEDVSSQSKVSHLHAVIKHFQESGLHGDNHDKRSIRRMSIILEVDPDLIGPWLQQFWATASLRVINEVPHIRAMVAGKRVLISEETIRADLLFDDADGVDCVSYAGMHVSPMDAQGTPTQSAAQASISQGTADLQGTAEVQGTAAFQGTAETQGTTDIPQSPNDYNTKRCRLKLWRDEDFWISMLYTGESKLKKRGKKQKKKVSSVKLGRNKDESNLSEEHHDHDDHFVFEDFDATEAVVTPDLERKSVETEKKEKVLKQKKERVMKQRSTARQSTVTPRTLNFNDEAGPSSPIRPTQEEEPEEQFKDDELLADISLNISRPRGLSIPGPMQSQPQQPTQATDPKEKGKGILVEEPKKKKLTLQQIRALETANDEEVARKVQAEWDAEEERKRLEALKKPKTISKKPTSLAQERTQMMSFLKG